jgi:lipid-A-disaccharide synthase
MDGLSPEVEESVFRAELGAMPGQRILGLLPGSRTQELARHLGPMLATARELARTRPDLIAALPLAPGLEPRGLSPAELGNVRLVRGRVHATQAFATACAVASGTATLETALFGTPLAIVYRTGGLNYALARRLVRLTRIGLPNIVAGSEVAPELLQGAFTPERLAAVLAPWLDDPLENAARRRMLAVVRERLGGPGASRRAAELLWALAA